MSLFGNFERVNFSFNPALFKDVSIIQNTSHIIENERVEWRSFIELERQNFKRLRLLNESSPQGITFIW